MYPPKLKKYKKKLIKHSNSRIDNYYWIKNNKKAIMDYVKKENEYSNFVMNNTNNLQSILFDEFKSRTLEKNRTIPSYYKGYYYYSIINKGDNYGKYYRKKNGNKYLLLDCIKLSKKYNFIDIGSFSISNDNNFLLYTLDTNGNEKYDIYVKNLKNNKINKILNFKVNYNCIWGINSNIIYYIKLDKSLRPYQVWKHLIQENKSNLLYEEKDEKFSINITLTNDENYILIETGSYNCNETYYIYNNDKYNSNDIHLICKRKPNHQYFIEHRNNKFYILTNQDNHINFKIMTANIDNINKWTNFINYDENIYIQSFHMFKKFMIMECLINGNNIIKYFNFEENKINEISYNGDYTINFEDDLNLNYKTNSIIYSYSTLSVPTIIYKLNINNKKLRTLKKIKFKKYHPELYKSEKIYVNNKLCMSIVYKIDLFKKNGSNPGYLYSYGSYGYNIEPSFNKYIISLLDRGYVYSIAHIRGSTYNGYQWYLDGKLMKKKNTFDDFIECSEFLINNKYVNENNLSIAGGSAGGLLMGAVINKKPKLYKNTILEVPFVDCLTTMLDETIPLTTGEYEEWGNPSENKKVYKYLLEYSPLDNIKNKKYPNILIITSLNDTRVNCIEPIKYCAKMRDIANVFNNNKRKLLMKTDLISGHSGTSERYQSMKNEAFKYSFILKNNI